MNCELFPYLCTYIFKLLLLLPYPIRLSVMDYLIL